jgi:hypothetical protein
MQRAKIKTAVPLSAGERYVEVTDSSKQLDRARKALGLKENESLLVFSDGEREFAVATDVHYGLTRSKWTVHSAVRVR